MFAINYLIFNAGLIGVGLIIRHFHIKELKGGLI